jgi:hypothetical protein
MENEHGIKVVRMFNGIKRHVRRLPVGQRFDYLDRASMKVLNSRHLTLEEKLCLISGIEDDINNVDIVGER